MHKTLSSLFLGVFLALVCATASAQTEAVEKKVLTAEDVAGKTFVYLDGSWGNRSLYLRKDGTFRICGGPATGCDEGTWSLDGDKLVRVHQTWFASVNHRPRPVTVSVNGKVGTFASLKAVVLSLEDKFPLQIIYDDPRK